MKNTVISVVHPAATCPDWPPHSQNWFPLRSVVSVVTASAKNVATTAAIETIIAVVVECIVAAGAARIENSVVAG